MYKYGDISKDEIYSIKKLWDKNRDFHREKSDSFSGDYENLIFDDRMNSIFTKDAKVTVAKTEYEQVIGYCLSVIEKGQGEIATLYVDENHREKGIGKILLDKHIRWFTENKCEDIFVNVLHNNESAIKLYGRLGFKKDVMRMRRPTD